MHSCSLHLQAPEDLCGQARSLQLDLRFLHQILKVHSAILQEVQKEAESLHASDQKGTVIGKLFVRGKDFSCLK